MIGRLLFVLLLLLPPIPAAAAETLAGSWALRLDGAIVMRFDLEPEGESWKGGWVKPGSFATDGKRFGSIKLPAIERTSDEGKAIGEWAELTFNDPRPGVEPDVFRLRLIAADKAELIYVGTGLAPYVLERVAAGALLGPFEEGRVYGAGPPRPALPSLPPRAQSQPPVQGPPIIGR